MVMTAFDPAHLHRFMPQLVRVTERLRDRWSRTAEAGIEMDLQAELMCFSVDAASGLSFGVDINTIEDERSELHAHLAAVFPILMRRINMPFPHWRYVRLPIDRAFDQHKAQIHRAIEGLVSEARDRVAQRTQDSGSPSDLLEAMLLGRDGDGSALSAEEVAGNVYTMLVASQDTTANSLAWTIYLLRTHPTAWDRLVEESRRILGQETVPRDLEQARSLTCRSLREGGDATSTGSTSPLPGCRPGYAGRPCEGHQGHDGVLRDALRSRGRSQRQRCQRIPAGALAVRRQGNGSVVPEARFDAFRRGTPTLPRSLPRDARNEPRARDAGSELRAA